MSSAKKLTILMIISLIFLVVMMVLRPAKTQQHIQVTLIDNTVTQSLDGQRRYFLIESELTGKQLINVPPDANCATGEAVTLLRSSQNGQSSGYRFISCP